MSEILRKKRRQKKEIPVDVFCVIKGVPQKIVDRFKKGLSIDKKVLVVDGRHFDRGGQTSLDDPAESKRPRIDDVLWAIKQAREENVQKDHGKELIIFENSGTGKPEETKRKRKKEKETDSSVA